MGNRVLVIFLVLFPYLAHLVIHGITDCTGMFFLLAFGDLAPMFARAEAVPNQSPGAISQLKNHLASVT